MQVDTREFKSSGVKDLLTSKRPMPMMDESIKILYIIMNAV